MRRGPRVQRRYEFQPYPVHEQVADFLRDHPWIVRLAFVLSILGAFIAIANADEWDHMNTARQFNARTETGAVAHQSRRQSLRRHHVAPQHAAAPVLDANGNRSTVCASGHRLCVTVAASAQPTLQCVVDHVEAAGVRITALGGIRRGHCSTRSMHPCGKALDINQTARDVNGPPRHISSAAASACGAVSGSWWASNPDNGHFQVGGWAGTHGNIVTASAHRRHHRHHRLARVQ